ncbi:uncharacterized protein LOC117649316 [Thrips palmi]|uniref:Uncharacterized protein LOC117649316 n=1 Tax=Thrips palmi TaxID=161013 RepID=A0A6P8ZRQ8_THRPL|nr:uncharacterized protein LOC117649316 [Thrips palmi]
MSDDYDECTRVARKLSKALTKPRKEDSFDEGKPRKSAAKFLSTLSKLKPHLQPSPVKKAKKSSKVSRVKDVLTASRRNAEALDLLSTTSRTTKGLSNFKATSSPDLVNDDMDGHFSDASLPSTVGASESESEEDFTKPSLSRKKLEQQLAAMQERIKQLDNKKLRHASNVHSTPLSSKNSPHRSDSDNGSSRSSSFNRTLGATFGALSSKGKKYEGEMLRYTEASEEAVELEGPESGQKTGIYCCRDSFECAQSGNSSTVCARRLLTGVFTENALRDCCLTGLPPRGKGKAAYINKENVIRPYLCPKASRAIVNQALYWQKKKYLRPRKDSTQIRAAMSIRICEIHKMNDV